MLGGFVGIDFSGGKVRTVTVKKGFKGAEIKKASFDGHLGDESVAGKLADLIPLGGKLIAGVSFSPVLLRVLRFPFSDPRKIDRVYRFELENSTGFALEDDLLSDYHEVTRGEGAEETEAIVPAFKKEAFANWLDSLIACGANPSQVTFSPVAFCSLEKILPEDRPLLLVDADEKHLNFSFFDERAMSRVRNCDHVMEKIAETSLFKTASFQKINGNLLWKKEFFENSGRISDEIIGTARYFESETGVRIKKFVLTGEICRLDGIEQNLSERMGESVERIRIPEIDGEDSPFFARAYAFALYGKNFSGGKNSGINLRKGEYKPVGTAGELLKNFKVPVALCAALVLLLVFGRAVEMVSARGKISSIRSEMEVDLKREFPEAAATATDPVVFYREKLESVKSKLDVLKQVRGAHSPLEVLRSVSDALPQDISFTVDEIRIEDRGITSISGRCESYEQVASIEKAFAESKDFTKVERKRVGKAVNNSLKFEISMVVR